MSPAERLAPSRARFTTIVLICVMALLASGAAALATSAPAAAHNALVSADPADGSTVETAPERVTLTFDDEVIELGSVIEVVNPDGDLVSTGEVRVEGATASQELAGDLPAGEYTVVWRITSADGHPVEGELGFVAANGVEPPATTTPPATTQSQTPPADEPGSGEETPAGTSTEPTPTAPTSATPTTSDATHPPAEAAGARGTLPAIVAGALVAAAVGIALLVRASVRRRR